MKRNVLIDGKWHHVAGTFDGQQINIYLDSKLVGSKEIVGKLYSQSRVPMEIGAYQDELFHGDINDVRLFRSGLSKPQIEEMAKAELENRKVAYEPLCYPEHGSTKRIKNIASIHDFSKHCKNNNIAHNIEHFLANITIKECEGNERGITWIEMYIVYRIRGNPAPYEYNE